MGEKAHIENKEDILMEVVITDLGIPLEVKTRGIDFEVRDNSGSLLGHLKLTSTKLEWRNRGIHRGNGIEIEWEDFIELMNDQG